MVAHAAFIPTWPKSHDQWGMLVAILGTTISPYLFFWQPSQEVEEDKAKGRRMLYRRFGANQETAFLDRESGLWRCRLRFSRARNNQSALAFIF